MPRCSSTRSPSGGGSDRLIGYGGSGSTADPAHLLVAVRAVEVGLEADTLDHGVGDGPLPRGGVRRRAQRAANVHLAPFKQARAEDALGGESQAVAGGAERGGHG